MPLTYRFTNPETGRTISAAELRTLATAAIGQKQSLPVPTKADRERTSHVPEHSNFYAKSPRLDPYPYKESEAWGAFVRHIEFGDDGFPNRQVDVFENGYMTRHDRSHWSDQFGNLADVRFGEKWREAWGEPLAISREEFEKLWDAAANSPPFMLRAESPDDPPPWIELFESGRWPGQK